MEKIIKFEEKQKLRVKYLDCIKDYVSNYNYYNNIEPCGNYLEFISNIDDFKSEEFKAKLRFGNFCKNRFCPMCSWRKSIADNIKISTIVKYTKIELNYDFLFLTLTVRNVTDDELIERINKLQEEVNYFMRYKDVKKFACGHIKKLELTYNQKADTYHPHLHLLIAVEKDYFKNNKKYMQRDDLLKLWQKATKDKSITQLDIRKAKNVEKELSKYTAKATDYVENKNTFNTFYSALKGRKLITYCGDFNQVNKMYKNGDLDYLIEIDDILYNYMIYYSKNVNKSIFEYELKELRELTEDEKIKYNNLLLKYEIEMED